MKKFLIFPALLLGVSLFSNPAFAAGKSAPKTTGDIGYTANDLQRYAKFEAIQTSKDCNSNWAVKDSNTIQIPWDNNTLSYDITLNQNGNLLTGTLLEKYLPSTTTLDLSGSIYGSSVVLYATYNGEYWGTRTFEGTINPNTGLVSGKWSDSGTGEGKGTWQTAFVFATRTTERCDAKGIFHYFDVNGAWYDVKVTYMSVSGNYAWFAGPVITGNVGDGKWLFAKVRDGGEPGKSVDQIWGSFLNEDQAKLGVSAMSDPSDGLFEISSGNLQVH